jgi:hypothetical protein
VRYDVGDCEIEVEWFHCDLVSGGDERRTFKVWAKDEAINDPGPESGRKYTFNSTELRLVSSASQAAGNAVQLEMRPLPAVGDVTLNVVQQGATRSSARVANKLRPNYRNVVFQATTVRAEPPTQLWEITSGSERVILDNCW